MRGLGEHYGSEKDCEMEMKFDPEIVREREIERRGMHEEEKEERMRKKKMQIIFTANQIFKLLPKIFFSPF